MRGELDYFIPSYTRLTRLVVAGNALQIEQGVSEWKSHHISAGVVVEGPGFGGILGKTSYS